MSQARGVLVGSQGSPARSRGLWVTVPTWPMTAESIPDAVAPRAGPAGRSDARHQKGAQPAGWDP
jgi:hypothetical protein